MTGSMTLNFEIFKKTFYIFLMLLLTTLAKDSRHTWSHYVANIQGTLGIIVLLIFKAHFVANSRHTWSHYVSNIQNTLRVIILLIFKTYMESLSC